MFGGGSSLAFSGIAPALPLTWLGPGWYNAACTVRSKDSTEEDRGVSCPHQSKSSGQEDTRKTVQCGVLWSLPGSGLVGVLLHDRGPVDIQALEGVHRHQDATHVGIDLQRPVRTTDATMNDSIEA
jgi:hypothetical protein